MRRKSWKTRLLFQVFKFMPKLIKVTIVCLISLLLSCTLNTNTDSDKNPHSPTHHLKNGRFQNPPASPISTATLMDTAKFFSKMIFSSPQTTVPEDHILAENDFRIQLAKASNPSVTWLGHAAFIIRIGGKVILTDPYLEKTAGPWGLGPKRFVDSPLKGSELPKADIMLISHNHYDHLDAKTVNAYPWKQDTQVIVPLGLGDFLPVVAIAKY